MNWRSKKAVKFQAAELFSGSADSLFPKKMVVAENLKRTLKPSRENGGWGDIRDHELCLNNSHVLNLATYDFDLNTLTANYTHIGHPLIFPM